MRLLVGVHCILVVLLTGVLTRRVLVTVTLVAGVIFQLTTTASFVTSTEFLVVAPMEISVALVPLAPVLPSTGLGTMIVTTNVTTWITRTFLWIIKTSALTQVVVGVIATVLVLVEAGMALLGPILIEVISFSPSKSPLLLSISRRFAMKSVTSSIVPSGRFCHTPKKARQ